MKYQQVYYSIYRNTDNLNIAVYRDTPTKPNIIRILNGKYGTFNSIQNWEEMVIFHSQKSKDSFNIKESDFFCCLYFSVKRGL